VSSEGTGKDSEPDYRRCIAASGWADPTDAPNYLDHYPGHHGATGTIATATATDLVQHWRHSAQSWPGCAGGLVLVAFRLTCRSDAGQRGGAAPVMRTTDRSRTVLLPDEPAAHSALAAAEDVLVALALLEQHQRRLPERDTPLVFPTRCTTRAPPTRWGA
jgi:hypothetical protein